MRLWFEIGLIFLNCVLISLGCVVYGFGRIRGPFRSEQSTPIRQCMTEFVLVAPFGVFALGAVIHNQLHHGMLAPVSRLLMAGVFVIYPLAGLSVVIHLENRWRRMLLIKSGWGRPVDLSSLGIKNKEGS